MDELTESDVEELRRALEALRQELQDVLESSRDGAKPVALDEPIGRLSRMDAMQQQQMVIANRASHEVRLRHVVHALDAMGKGEYGACRRCEEPIGLARLRARPEAPFCLECQDEIDSAR